MSDESYRRSRAFAVRAIDEDLILVPVSAGAADMDSIFVLNEVGRLIWENVETKTFTGIVALVVAAFDVERNVAEADTRSFLAELTALNAIRPMQEGVQAQVQP
jgi:hypothetical protein